MLRYRILTIVSNPYVSPDADDTVERSCEYKEFNSISEAVEYAHEQMLERGFINDHNSPIYRVLGSQGLQAHFEIEVDEESEAQFQLSNLQKGRV